MDALRRIVRGLSASARAVPARAGVTGAQLFVLRQIAAAPGISVGELARRTLAGQSTVSEVAARLVERGLATRSTSAADARQTALTATAKGHRALAGAAPTTQERLAEGLEALSAAQRDTLAGALEAWLAAAGLAATPATMFFEDQPAASRAGRRTARRRAADER